eukprot:2190853-Karenia_brevis.AAC.1
MAGRKSWVRIDQDDLVQLLDDAIDRAVNDRDNDGLPFTLVSRTHESRSSACAAFIECNDLSVLDIEEHSSKLGFIVQNRCIPKSGVEEMTKKRFNQ